MLNVDIMVCLILNQDIAFIHQTGCAVYMQRPVCLPFDKYFVFSINESEFWIRNWYCNNIQIVQVLLPKH